MIETDTVSKQSKSEESKLIGDKEKVEALKRNLMTRNQKWRKT